MTRTFLSASALFAILGRVAADLNVYSDGDGALASGWQDWSWSSTINYASTTAETSTSISVASQAWAAFSLYYSGGAVLTSQYVGLKFDILGNVANSLQFYLSSTGDGDSSATVPFSVIAPNANSSAWTHVTLDFSNLPGNLGPVPTDTWDRINFQATGNGATYYLDNVVFVTELVIIPKFLSAEPIGHNTLAVTTQGKVDLTTVNVWWNNTKVAISSSSTYSPPDTPALSITYYTLAKPWAPGTVFVTAGNATNFTSVLPATEYGALTTGNQVPISPLIYGINFPTDGAYIKELGTTISRWGGNAVTAYNPFGGFTNAGNDWYFENRANDNADDWIGWVKGNGSLSFLTIPALDWVAKDASSYSYPKTIYPTQQSYDPYLSDAGDGVFPNGSYIEPAPPQTRAYTPWNTTLASQWLAGLTHKPDIVTVDNEIEIASNTHQDMHPAPMPFDEELARVIATGTMAKATIPGVKLAAPSTCAWWFYWTSEVGYSDNAAHDNIDWLPWFLAQMAAHDKSTGSRLLDYLDIHYYYAPDTSAGDAAALATRLRMTRSLWDPSYIDESYIGTANPPQWNEPNPNAVWLIPRMKALIAQHYPGTKLSISEWSSGYDSDITGGLIVADVLGIYGIYGVDSATYWATPDPKSPAGLAFWLYRGYGVNFGANSVQVTLSEVNQSVLGVYAGISNNKVSLVIVNKDVKPVGLTLSNVPSGKYFTRHFGGAAGVAKWQTNVTLSDNSYITVPSYTSIFFLQQ